MTEIDKLKIEIATLERMDELRRLKGEHGAWGYINDELRMLRYKARQIQNGSDIGKPISGNGAQISDQRYGDGRL